LGDRQTEAAFIWLPIPHADIRYEVLATEQVYVALSSSHPFARRPRLQFAEIADEPIVALPVEAGPQRDFWLGSDARRSLPARIAVTVDTADETFEVVSSGAGVALLAEGNARIYRRSGIRCVLVQGLPPARLAIAWRQQNRHPAVRAFVQACQEAVGTQRHAIRICTPWPLGPYVVSPATSRSALPSSRSSVKRSLRLAWSAERCGLPSPPGAAQQWLGRRAP
jgi:DNA-binding transcriptional LysR family regulator